MAIDINDLIDRGRFIEKGLTYVHSPEGVMRLYDVYRPANVDEYYSWKELSVRFLQLYYPDDLERFKKYSEDFERHHYIPCFISNMVGVLEACEAMPSDKAQQLNETQDRLKELAKVEDLERNYRVQTSEERIHKSDTAFHDWHAAACVLFDKWFYATDEDWIKFQNIDGDGNGFVLKHDFDKIYSPYRKLMARLRDGRNLKRTEATPKVANRAKGGSLNKINIFVSYAHADKKWLEKLQQHLKVLSKYYENIERWDDTKLRGGDKWREEISSAINKANVAILLVSTAFLASDFIANDELPPILRKAEEEKGTRILPLIVSPCDFEDSEISEFQAINDPGRTLADLCENEAAVERVFLELNNEIKSLIE